MTAADSHHKKSQVKNKFPLSLKKNGIQNDPGTMISESHTGGQYRDTRRGKEGQKEKEEEGEEEETGSQNCKASQWLQSPQKRKQRSRESNPLYNQLQQTETKAKTFYCVSP